MKTNTHFKRFANSIKKNLLTTAAAGLLALPGTACLAGDGAPTEAPTGAPTEALTEALTVPSVLKSATVYRNAAELVHTARTPVRQGNNEFVIEGLSNNIDINSIRVGADGNVTILSVEFSTQYLKPETKSPVTRRLEDSLDSIHKELEKLSVLMKSDNDLLDLLATNKKIGGTQDGMTVAELAKMMDYYKGKTLELRTELSAGKEKELRLNTSIERLNAQLLEEDRKNTKTSGRLALQLLSPLAGNVIFTVSYLTTTAHWNPAYDLRVDNINSPIKLLYKAKLVQTSGIDWKQVKLALSTSIPNQGGNAPILTTWFLRNAEPFANLNRLKSNTIQSGLAGQAPGLQLNETVVAGYGTAKAGKNASQTDAGELGDYVSVNDNAMNVTFDIDVPYDVPSNGKEQSVVLKEYAVPSIYKYYSVPKLDKDAYLLGEVADWEKLNLLPGEANIIFEGTYVGKSYIDPNSTLDTLNLTLGRDKRVVVKREKVVDYSSVKFMGSNKKQVFTYEITVKNNKKEKIQLLLKDQYPISSAKEIEEELLESSGAEVNKDTGVLTWKVELAPGASKTYRISYSVKYPKDKTVNAN
jgi:uncharacterized protein (TIGR02231 family)